MRLNRLWIDGWHNLRDVTIDFDDERLTTVIIGQNGAGKSNLLEAIAYIFRNADLGDNPPPFVFDLEYHINGLDVRLADKNNEWSFAVDGLSISRTEFVRRKDELFPDLVFGYYSGGNNRLESIFNTHQKNYYRKIIREEPDSEKRTTIDDRRLFYCRPVHGVLALLCFFAFPEPDINRLLEDMLGITGFHSAMVLFRQPWFAKSVRARSKASDFWGARGRPGWCARHLRDNAFFPLALTARQIDDYREKGGNEQQFCVICATPNLWIFSPRTLEAIWRCSRRSKASISQT